MRKPASAALLLLCIVPSSLWAAEPAGEDAAYHAASVLYTRSTRDRSGAADAFRRFYQLYPRSPRAADAHFACGEIAFDRALALAAADPSFARDRLKARVPEAALKALDDASQEYEAAQKKADDDGLRATARYRLGETAYNARDWDKAARSFKEVADTWPKSYVVPEALLGLVYVALAREDFPDAEAWARKLGQAYPERLKAPDAAFVLGALAFHNKDYAQAEKLLSPLDAPEARLYLGKTYLAWEKPLLAATVLNRLVEDNAVVDLREAASFAVGDAFLRSKSYDGAIDRYAEFSKSFPFSRYRVAALYRTGGASFLKGEYGQARLSFGSLLSQYPSDFYASLARYFIGESYLVADQTREALFAYTEVAAAARPELKPQALYRLAWAQQSLGDFTRAEATCRTFLEAFPSHPLAKNVYLIQANSLARLKKPALALQAYQRILDVAPGSDAAEEAVFLMLKLQYDQKDYNSILTSYQYLLRQLPQSLSKWRGLSYLTAAETYLRLGRADEARALYEMILKVYPNDAASVYAQDGLAWSYELSGRHTEALAARERLASLLKVERSTFSFAAVNDLGIADSFYAQKDFNDAFTFYDKFAAANPESPALAAALYRAGLSLYRLHYYTQAVETWKKLVEKAPASPEAEKASWQIADTLFRGGKRAEAAEAYKRMLERAPAGPQAALASLREAQLAHLSGDEDLALERAKAVVLGFPQAGEAADALDLAEAVFDAEPKRDAAAWLSALVAADPRGASAGEIQFRLGRRLYERKDYEEAAKALERFSVEYTGHPSLAKAQLLLGLCYASLGRDAEAAAAFERYTVNYPQAEDMDLALFKQGVADYGLKSYAKAASAFEKLLADWPKSEYAKAARFNLALAYRGDGKLDQAATAYQGYIAGGATAEEAQAARWELLALAKERKDARGALKTLEEIRAKAAAGSDTALSAAYEVGELAAASGDAEAAVSAWESAAKMKPAGSAYRLQSLIKLSEIYEKRRDWSKAISAYEDLAANANSAKMSAAARERIKELRTSASAAAPRPNP